MKTRHFFILPVLLSFFTTPVMAAGEWKNPDLKEQAQGRQARQPDVAPAPVRPPLPAGSYALVTTRICNYRQSYRDRGSGGKQDVSFYAPLVPPGFHIIGSYAQGNYHEPADCVLAVSPADKDSNLLIRLPVDWKRVWTDKGSGAQMDGSVWHPVSDRSDYACLGSVAVKGYDRPAQTGYVCVHQCLTELVPATNPVWSDHGTGAKYDMSVYRLHNSNTVIALPHHNRPGNLLDLKSNPVCKLE